MVYNRNMKCETCGRQYRNHNSYIKHLETHEPKVKGTDYYFPEYRKTITAENLIKAQQKLFQGTTKGGE